MYKRIRLIFSFLRCWPLIFIYMISKSRDTIPYSNFKSDIVRLNCKSVLKVFTQRPYYKEVFYVRYSLPVSLCRFLFGSYEVHISKCHIGKGLFLEHPHGSHLNAEYIGENFTCLHNVTLGKNRDGLPALGNNVFCGVGACVLGPVRIGNNVKIGANCVVLKDVPDNCTVIGNPAIIVKQNGNKVNIPL